ncbi:MULTISPECIES: hypothetical protein [Streptomyces]|uniref:hypothetical protein n=1 Tax=Streptomyces TaxID=1883 RepID=UPI001317D68E|nr:MULTISPECIES: hypothetical protein [Streptomyces]QGZ50962.1 hypothetical protein GPZ77_23605 [Streptomyces sp. QHH-9511]GGT81205.1 hypothetical protein GCM10010272_26910 [Streptomyces lateritius]
MSMPPPSHNPQPYGPPSHNPYAGQVPPPPQGFPPQGVAPQGVPPQYPAPGAGTWGQPPMPPAGPPAKRKMSTGAIVALVVGSLVLIGGLGYGVKLVADGTGVTGSFPEATHRLVVPKTLLDGSYTLTKDASDTEGKEVEDTYDPTVKDAKAAIAQYSGPDGAVLVVSGFHGRIKNPASTRASILRGAAKEKGSTLAVPPKEFTPAGHGVTVSCQVTTNKDALGTATLPMCAWGDDNTASFVAVVTPESATADPKDVDLAELAETTAKVRAEMRKPIG